MSKKFDVKKIFLTSIIVQWMIYIIFIITGFFKCTYHIYQSCNIYHACEDHIIESDFFSTVSIDSMVVVTVVLGILLLIDLIIYLLYRVRVFRKKAFSILSLVSSFLVALLASGYSISSFKSFLSWSTHILPMGVVTLFFVALFTVFSLFVFGYHVYFMVKTNQIKTEEMIPDGDVEPAVTTIEASDALQPTTSSPEEVVEKLKALKKLYDEGIISEQEYIEKKEKFIKNL